MATFEVQVEGLTGITISSSATYPTQAQLTEFLKDGVIDVTSRCLAVKPQEAYKFQKTTTSDSQGVGLEGATIISVMREANADGSSDGSTAWRDCRKVASSLQSRVIDTDSLHFASIYNPVYIIDNNNAVNVYPTPSSNNGIKIFHVNKAPVNGSSASLAYSHDDILYFPEDKVYLVIIYASMKSLQNAMSGLDVNTEFTTAVDAANIALDRVASYNWGDADTFTSGSAQLTRVKAAIDNAEDLINSNQPSATTDAYGAQAAEDVELVGSALNIAKTEISRAQAHIQEWNTLLGGALQESQGFIQEANTRIQKLTQNYNWYAGRYKDLKAEYDAAFVMMRPPQPQQGAR